MIPRLSGSSIANRAALLVRYMLSWPLSPLSWMSFRPFSSTQERAAPSLRHHHTLASRGSKFRSKKHVAPINPSTHSELLRGNKLPRLVQLSSSVVGIAHSLVQRLSDDSLIPYTLLHATSYRVINILLTQNLRARNP
jgi:hypothetical protein